MKEKRNVKRQNQRKKGGSKQLVVLILIAVLVLAVVFGVKYFKNDSNKLSKSDIHEDVNLSSKENSYYQLLYKAMHEHEDLIEGVENVYFNLYDLEGLEYEEKNNVAQKVLHSFKVHKDKELLIDTFDGLFFRGILDQETSELKDGIYVTFEELEEKSEDGKTQLAISIYKNSNLNPKLTYEVDLDKDGKIVSYTKLSDLMPHEDVELEESDENGENTESEE